MGFLLRTVVNAVALGVASWLVGGIYLTGADNTAKVLTLLVVAVIFGVFNAILKPLFTIVTIPIVLLTLGLFLIVINACMLLLTSWLAGVFGLGWHVDGFWTAVWGSIIVSIVSFIGNAVFNSSQRGGHD
ncbi:MAG: phage holin family protein [Microlunatus sp.]|nr:phage holin family protein [Microlunatus sp.]MDN5804451.1 phage holin family protein [Microlunatus sp.]